MSIWNNMAENTQYPSGTIKEISELFALKDSTLVNYQKGPELVELFNTLGFNDVYSFENGIGIRTPDFGDGLSRIQYVTKRLEELNKKFLVPDAIQELISRCREPEVMAAAFKDILSNAPQTGYVPQVMKVSEYTAQSVPVPTQEEKLQLSKKQLEDTVLGEIPDCCPVVFISYSWDSKEHQEWVGQLADDLTEKGAYVLFDQYIDSSVSLTSFMELGIERADKVVVIGTEQYRLKSFNVSGGAPLEGLIIRNGLLSNIGTTKIIPCLRQGSFYSSFPSSIADRKGEDFLKDENYNDSLEALWQDINNKPARKRPVIGQPQKATRPAPATPKEAASTDYRRDNDVKWLNILLGNFSFRLMQGYIENGPSVEPSKLCESYDAWNYYINQVTFVIFDKQLESKIMKLYKLWSSIKNVGVKYYVPIGSDMTRFRFSGLQADVFVSPKAESDFMTMSKSMTQMLEPLKELAQYVMLNYEMDIESLSRSYELRK